MSKVKDRNRRIECLAFVHHYVFPVLVFGTPFLCGKYAVLAMGIGLIILAAYDLLGYLRQWKHIYCSWQKAHRQRMTPDDIRWSYIKKQEIYGVVAVTSFVGIVSIFVFVLYL
ncbi:MAG: hypothetical protein IKV68_00640 [Oscillospiraceae bacterium]|nr:hypothetical protein [Oscillospiraceae bacterium]MBR5216844.1 hypothetical protein [Oscillospiraceae bacterium]